MVGFDSNSVMQNADDITTTDLYAGPVDLSSKNSPTKTKLFNLTNLNPQPWAVRLCIGR